jgi:hypothetical protein
MYLNEFLLFEKVQYSFDSSGNNLTISGGSLVSNSNLIYQFVIQAIYKNIVYSQTLTIQVSNLTSLPVASLQYSYFF